MSPRKRLKNRRIGHRVEFGSGSTKLHLSTGEFEDGTLGEIFLDASKEGAFSRDMMNAFAMCVSLGLQHGVPLSAFLHTYRDFKTEDGAIGDIFAFLKEHYGGKV